MLAGLDVRRVHVECDIGRGNDVKFGLVGLATTTVNLAPAELRKEGDALDLPIPS